MAGGQNSTSPNWMKSTTPEGIMGGLEGMMTGSAYEQKNPPNQKPKIAGAFTPTANQFTDTAQQNQPLTLRDILNAMQGTA